MFFFIKSLFWEWQILSSDGIRASQKRTEPDESDESEPESAPEVGPPGIATARTQSQTSKSVDGWAEQAIPMPFSHNFQLSTSVPFSSFIIQLISQIFVSSCWFCTIEELVDLKTVIILTPEIFFQWSDNARFFKINIFWDFSFDLQWERWVTSVSPYSYLLPIILDLPYP